MVAQNRIRPYGGATEVIERVVKQSYTANSSTPTSAVRTLLRQQGVNVSERHIRRVREKLGFKRRTVKYCQMIRDVNKLKRVEFCTAMLNGNETFSDCVFTDECTIQVEGNVRRCFTQDGDQERRLRSRPKHPAKIHVWGGISARGTTDLVLFAGGLRMDSKMYCGILERSYLKFVKKQYHGFARLAQDNAPAHKSAYTMKWMREKGVKTLDWPPESPDLNPIELLKCS
ncbi:hypothetical protein Q1695_000824 [Nippostrongylus brasiliensis]|nr:hypothetical protein Q1695_000824 [Nippostrongylus brasiliensis]